MRDPPERVASTTTRTSARVDVKLWRYRAGSPAASGDVDHDVGVRSRFDGREAVLGLDDLGAAPIPPGEGELWLLEVVPRLSQAVSLALEDFDAGPGIRCPR